ncbi:MAG: type II toxin-antitoxin system HicA family toxin [Candidatus Omnitrophica bacterium]|nr:type II toxin-antitoxin system HicA family toxin [Candidatus Omnitrophota bacterium]
MNKRLPRLKPDEIIRAVERLGFYLARQSGSHKIYKNKKGMRITIPYHKGKILHPKIIKSVLKDAEIDIDKLYELLR